MGNAVRRHGRKGANGKKAWQLILIADDSLMIVVRKNARVDRSVGTRNPLEWKTG